MIGVEPEIVKCAEPNRIRVRIGPDCFRAPCDNGWVCGVDNPRCAAIPGIALSSIVREARLLDRCVKPDVSNVDSSPYRHAERLNAAIEVLVIHRVLIVPDAVVGSCHLVTDEENPVACRRRPRSWLELIYGRAGPGFNSWLLPLG